MVQSTFNRKRIIYSDLNIFTPKVMPFVDNEKSVYQHIALILATTLGTRFFSREVGGTVEDLLFEPIDRVTAARLESDIFSDILRQDARVTIDASRSSVVPYPDEHKYEVTIGFQIIGLEGQKFEYRATLYTGV